MSIFGIVKGAKADRPHGASLTIPDGRYPLSSVFAEMNPGETALPNTSKVLQIGSTVNIPKVAYAVVGFDPVSVVDLIDRPRAIHVKPSEPAQSVFATIEIRPKVAKFADRSDNIANSIPTPVVGKTRKNTGLRIVIQKLAKSFSGKIGHSASIKGHHGEGWPSDDESLFRPLKLGQSVNPTLA